MTILTAISNRLHNLKYFNYPKNHIFDIDVDGIKFKMSFLELPLEENIIQRIEGRRELDTIAVLKSILRKDHKVLELGSCYGYFTCIIANLVNEVVSVDAEEHNERIMEKNIELNKLKNVRFYRRFLTKRKGKYYDAGA